MKDEIKLKNSLNDASKLKKTYEYLFYKYKGLVAFIVSKYLNFKEDIDDAISETFLELFNNPNSVNTSIKGFLSITAKNKALILLKENKKVDLVDDDSIFVTSDSSASYAILISELQSALTNKEFIILYNHLVLDKTFKEIAKDLATNENSIKTIYFRTIKKAREEIFNEKKWTKTNWKNWFKTRIRH